MELAVALVPPELGLSREVAADGSLEQQPQDDFLNYTVTILIRWLPSRKGPEEEELFLRY